uniref:Uncharacterized protein n=1 Tax=Anguilla anguilla TaxID=7936 RepID=A0A0E9RVI7_ANGAN
MHLSRKPLSLNGTIASTRSKAHFVHSEWMRRLSNQLLDDMDLTVQ